MPVCSVFFKNWSHVWSGRCTITSHFVYVFLTREMLVQLVNFEKCHSPLRSRLSPTGTVSVSRFAPRLGHPPTQWDNHLFGSINHQRGGQPDTNNGRIPSRRLLLTQRRLPIQRRTPTEDRRYVCCGPGSPTLGVVREPRCLSQYGPGSALLDAALYLRTTNT